jgi:ribose transport system substrate-binding protein
MTLTSATLGAMAAVLSFAAASAAEKVPVNVGITVGTLGNPFFIPLVAGAKAAVLEANPKATVTTVGADYDLAKQTNQINSFIAAGTNLIMVNAVDVNAVAPVIQRAKDAGIVVGAFDVSAKGADVTVMTNNKQAGQIACAYLADQLKGHGKVIIINGPPVSSILDRVAGCKEAFGKASGIEIVSDDQDGKASRDGGLTVMQSLLTRFPHIDAVFGANDPTALGADLAAKQRGRSEMIIAGVDGSPDMLAALKGADSRIVASASQDPYGMAKQATELAIGIMQGKAPPQRITLLDTQLVTKENAATFKGWDAAR